jgi:hypothetical protein
LLQSLTQTLLSRAAARLWNQGRSERGEHNTRVRGTTLF